MANTNDCPVPVKIFDFRSDTLSLPSEKMREVIFRAEVGDAMFDEDPSVLELESKSAKIFQKEAACFVPSGTMSNLIAVLVHCKKRGSEILTGSKSHIVHYEQTGVAQFGGVNIREVENKPDGTFSLRELGQKIRPKNKHAPHSSLICIENTHNILGGKVLPQEWIEELCAFAKLVELPVHMDGARIFSASVKLNIPVSQIVKNVDSVTFCLSKNLGGPYGSMLLGTKEFIEEAKRTIKGVGGATRQVGFMAAAGIFVLDNMVSRLADDHDHAQLIADAIRDLKNPHMMVPPSNEIHTNMLIVRLNTSKITPAEFMQMLTTVYAEEKRPAIIKLFSLEEDSVRFVLHCNYSRQDVLDAIEKIRLVVNKIG